MSEMTRREWTKRALGSLAAAAAATRGVADVIAAHHVVLGAQSYSFRDRGFDQMVDGFKACGLSDVELWQGHFEPKTSGRDELRTWRLQTPDSYFKDLRSKLDAAGIHVYAVNISFRDDWTDEEVQKGFDQAAALGVKTITASSNQATVGRIGPIAEKRGVVVGVHNHSNINPNEFATPDDFEKAMKASSGHSRQPRHRALHRREFRRGGVHQDASRQDCDPASQGSKEGSGPQPAVRSGRHADQACPDPASRQGMGDSRRH